MISNDQPIEKSSAIVRCTVRDVVLVGVLLLSLGPITVDAQQVLIIDVEVFGLNENQVSATEQLTDACNSLGGSADNSAAAQDLQNTCQLVSSLDSNDPEDISRLQQILDSVGPEEAFSLNDSLVYVSDYQTTNVQSRINALRQTPLTRINLNSVLPSLESSVLPDPAALLSGVTLSDLSNSSNEGALPDGLISRLGVFFSGHVSDGDVDGDTFEQDAKIDSGSFTIGSDYRFSSNLVAGAGLGVLQNTSKFSNVAGSTESEGVNVSLFGSWFKQDTGYFDLVFDFGSNSYDLERDISIDPARPVRALGSTDSSSFSISLGGGGTYNAGSWDLGGYFRLSLTDATVDAYTESASADNPGSGSVFTIGSQSVKSQKLVFGVEASRAFSTSKAVIVPVVRVELETENEESKDDVRATLVASQVTGIYQGTERDASHINLGLGASVIMAGGKSAFAFYETNLQHDFVTQNWLKAGFRFEF